MNKILKATTSLLTSTMLFGGIIVSPTCNQQTFAVYDDYLEYDPDAQPNYDAVYDIKSLTKELRRLDWFRACCISVGRFQAKGGFGIVPPGYQLPDERTTKWTIYKGWERTNYDIIREYDNEIDACRAFLRAVQRRAQQHGRLVDWRWRPNVD